MRPDVVHFFNLHNLGMSLPGVCRERGVPTVFSSNNYWSLCPRLYLFDDALARCSGAGDGGRCAPCLGVPERDGAYRARASRARELLNGGFDAHLAVSQRARTIFLENGVAGEHVRVVPQQPKVLDLLWRTVGSRRVIGRRRPGGKLRVGFIGSLLPHKGVHVLAHALQQLPADRVVGVLHGDVAAEYRVALQRLDRNGVLEFGGAYALRELPLRLADLDVVVVPSIWEDCAPFVVAEAQAARLPVVGSRIGGIPDFFTDGRTGIAVAPGDPRDLAAGLRRFLEEPELLPRMQRAIAPPVGFDAYLDQLAGVYEEVSGAEAAVARPVREEVSAWNFDSCFRRVFERVDAWFAVGEPLFPFDGEESTDSIEALVHQLAYHNQQIWHYEDLGRSEVEAEVVQGWRGAQHHNTRRNAAINAVDALMRPLYRDAARLHSETLGSILDRTTIQYLKHKNFLSRDPAAAAALRGHIDELIGCAQVLFDEVQAGRSRCLELPRMKLYFAAVAP